MLPAFEFAAAQRIVFGVGGFDQLGGLAAEHGEKTTVMIDATYLKAHRTATSMAAKKGGVVA